MILRSSGLPSPTVLVGLVVPLLAVFTHASNLDVRDATANKTIPAPVSVSPDQDWMGIDGSWNTVSLRVGNPAQNVRVLVSTASQQTWAVHYLACAVNQTDPTTKSVSLVRNDTCFQSRGRTFNFTASSSWVPNGFFQLWTEKNLGLTGNGQYGYETVGLGLPGETGPTILNTTVATLVTPSFWLGHLGVNPKPTNFSEDGPPSPSYMTYMFEQRQIPSLSFGYTAGSRYRSTTVLSSLTLGGHDSSRYIPNDLSFGFAPDNERDIIVGVANITAKSNTKANIPLFNRDTFTMYIDSTVAELWLPVDVCALFESAFGLKYDNRTGLYLVDDLLHQTLQADNPSVTFTLGRQGIVNGTVDITLPYGAFDLTASAPYQGLNSSSRYFPIRRGSNQDQFVLGRTFLQEAYIVVDWERANFSVYACNWTLPQQKSIVPILSPKYTGEKLNGSSHPLSTGAIIGIALGAGFALALALCGTLWWFWRRRQKRRAEQQKMKQEAQAAAEQDVKYEKVEEPPMSPVRDADEKSNVFPKAELPAEYAQLNRYEDAYSPTSHGSLGMPSPIAEVDNTERQIFEMPGCTPLSIEAGGRQLSEKETMIVRERRINGVDPNETSSPAETSPQEPPRRPPPIVPSEVTLVGRRMPNVSPITPRTPRSPQDGSSLEANDTFFQPPGPRTPRDGRYLEGDDTLFSPISPMEGSADSSRRRFSYEG